MSDGIDVSVVIPTFDGADYLEECLASVAVQDLDGVEVLVIDDGSRDATVAIAESFADRIPNLRVLRNEVNLGPSANLQRCITEARGSWIKPVFQDDLIEPGCLTAMRTARRRGVPVVVCGRRYLYEHGVPEWRVTACDHLLAHALDRRFGSGHVPKSVVAELAAEMAAERVPQLNFIGEPVAVLFERREALRMGGVDTGYVQLWDLELVLRLALRRGIVVVAEPLAAFRVHEASETARNLQPGALFRTNVMDRLRLGVAYAAGRPYRAVRLAAEYTGTRSDLEALALGTANAGRRLVDELPEADRADAVAELETVAAPLPAALDWGSEEELIASEAEVALFCIVSTQPNPELLPIRERPTVIPPLWQRLKLRVQRLLHTATWWNSLLGPILAMGLLQVGWRDVAPGEAFGYVGALVVATIAIACFGHLLDDAVDVGADRAAGRTNLVGKAPPLVRAALIAAFAVAGLVPWAFVELEPGAAALLAATYAGVVVMAIPRLRLRDRRVVGPVVGATVTRVLPVAFAVALFATAGPGSDPGWLMVVGALLWSVGFGLRTHLLGAATDDVSGPPRGPRARALARLVLVPVELVGLALLGATVATWSWPAVAVAVGWVVILGGTHQLGVFPATAALSPVDRGGFTRWYELWPALLLGLALTVIDPANALVLALVIVLRWGRLVEAMATGRRALVRERARRWRAHERAAPPPDRMSAVAALAEVAAAEAPPGSPLDAEPQMVAAGGERSLPRRVVRALRTNQWWGHMLGPIVAFACLQLGWRQIAPDEGIVRVLALVASAVALAGYGYVVNDTADIVPDRLAGKRNAMAKLPGWARPLLIAAFAAAGAIPWLVLPLEPPALAALAVIYLLPIVYSLPPVRLKERHVLGALADASNAFAVPALFTIALFAPLGEPTGPPWLMVLGAVAWTYGFGLRAIVNHQIADADNDRASGTTTLVTRVGEARALWAIRSLLFPLELIGLALLTVTVATWSWGTVAVVVVLAAAFQALRLGGLIDRGLATTTLAKGYWMYWYQIWPAFALSLGLAAWDREYLVLTGFVVFLFWPRFLGAATSVRHAIAHERRRRQRSAA